MSLPGGYSFRPSRYSPAIGHTGLDLELTGDRRVTARCLTCATFPVVLSRPVERTFACTRRSDPGPREFPVYPGGFRLRTGTDNCVYGFEFGGWLSIGAGDGLTVCRLESSAPVFNLGCGQDSPDVFIISSLLGQLACRRATWGRDDAGFERRLASLEPFTLFVAGLSTLDAHLGRFAGAPALGQYHVAHRAVRRYIDTLRRAGQWPSMPPVLSDIL